MKDEQGNLKIKKRFELCFFLTHGIKQFYIKYFMILNTDSKHNYLLVFNHSFLSYILKLPDYFNKNSTFLKINKP